MKILKILSLLVLFTTTKLFSQISIPDTATIVENFDGMMTGTSTPSTNWRVQKSGGAPAWSSGKTVPTEPSMQRSSSGTPTFGGFYNWGNETKTTDRSLGAMTSVGYSSPNRIMGWYRNTNVDNLLISLNISYILERYRINTAAASVEFWYSTNGSDWTRVTSGDISSGLTTGSSSYDFNPSGTPSSTNCGIISKKGISITGLTICNDSSIYLRWDLISTGLNSQGQGIGIDDINVTAGFEYDVPLDLEAWIRNNPKPEYIPKTVIVSDCDEPSTYYDFIGKKVEKLQPNRTYIKKSCGHSEMFIIIE